MYYTFYFRKATELSSLYLVLRESKEKEVIPLGIKEDPSTFNRDIMAFTKQNIHYKILNEKLTRIKELCDRGIREMFLVDGNLSDYRQFILDNMNLRGEKNTSKQRFLPYFLSWCSTTTTKRKASRQRVQSYQRFAEFCNWKGIDPTFSMITYKLSEEYIEWMANQGMVANSRGTKMKDLKACMHESYKMKLHKNTEFNEFRKEVEEVDNVYLTSEEVEKIANLPLTSALDKARDIFLVGCHTGMRFSDYSRVTSMDITDGVIHNINQKTYARVDIPAHPRVIAILDKWGGSLPKMPQSTMNECLKIICMRAGICAPVTLRRNGTAVTKEKWEFVTTHTARRTGITNMYKAGIPIYRCMMISGHKSERVFLQYIKIGTEENAQFLAENPFFKGK